LVLPRPSSAASLTSDCAAYDSLIRAQSIYDTDPARYAALDPDGNCIACEELPPGIAPALWTNAIPADAVVAQFVSVSDGDTIHVLIDGQRETVRLIFFDTPETHRPNAPAECFGKEATDLAKARSSLEGNSSI
jgi:endonuclease YncB( thermonuclease family)